MGSEHPDSSSYCFKVDALSTKPSFYFPNVLLSNALSGQDAKVSQIIVISILMHVQSWERSLGRVVEIPYAWIGSNSR